MKLYINMVNIVKQINLLEFWIFCFFYPPKKSSKLQWLLLDEMLILSYVTRQLHLQ